MADDPSNDDQWLYGDSISDSLDANNDGTEEKKTDKPSQEADQSISEASLLHNSASDVHSVMHWCKTSSKSVARAGSSCAVQVIILFLILIFYCLSDRTSHKSLLQME